MDRNRGLHRTPWPLFTATHVEPIMTVTFRVRIGPNQQNHVDKEGRRRRRRFSRVVSSSMFCETAIYETALRAPARGARNTQLSSGKTPVS
jgi:hypothetical protein